MMQPWSPRYEMSVDDADRRLEIDTDMERDWRT